LSVEGFGFWVNVKSMEEGWPVMPGAKPRRRASVNCPAGVTRSLEGIGFGIEGVELRV